MPFRMGVRTSHIDEISESMGFLLMGENFSVSAASTAVTSSAFCIFWEVGVTRFDYVAI